MALNIRPFDFNYRGLGPPPKTISVDEAQAKDVSKQLQEGIGNLLPELAKSYQAVNQQKQMELTGADLMAQKAQQAGSAYGVTSTGAPITAANASPQPQGSAIALKPEIEQLVQQESQRTGISPDYYRQLFKTESAGDPSAKSSLSSAKGLGQFTDATWGQYGQGDPLNAADNVAATGRLTVDNKKALASVLQRDPTNGELYLAHQQGAGGAKALLANPNGNVVDVLADVYGGDRNKALKAVTNNGGNANMTAGQFSGKWTGAFGGTGAAPPSPTAVASVVQPGDTVAPGASAVSGGRLSDPVLAYKSRLQEMFPQVRITSEFRSAGENQAVGGAKGSQHLSGNALDINTTGMSEEQKAAVINDAIANGAKGIGWYNPNSMHVDFRQNPAAWGPNKSASTLGRTPPWFREAAQKLTAQGNQSPVATPVQPGAPAAVAAQNPGAVPRSGTTQGSTASGQQAPPLFNTPVLAGATAASGNAPGSATQPPNPTQPQPANPTTDLAGAPPPPQPMATGPNPIQPGPPTPSPTAAMVAGPGAPAAAGPTGPTGPTFSDVLSNPDLPPDARQYFTAIEQQLGPAAAATPINPNAIMADPQAPPGAKQVAQVVAGGRDAPLPPPRPAEAPPPAPAPQTAPTPVNPRQGPAGLQTDPNAPPPAAPARPIDPSRRSSDGPATTGSVPPQVQQAGVRAGLSPEAAGDPLTMRMLGRAFMTGNPGVVQATVGAIRALTEQRAAASGEGGWTFHKDSKTGQEIRFNSKTGERQVIAPGGAPAMQQDLILQPGDPRRKQFPGIPDDKRTYRVHPTSDSLDITPLDEREEKTFQQEQQLATGFETNDIVKKYRGMEQGLGAVRSAFEAGTPESDMLGIIQMFKTIDPTSTVSAGETANAENAPGVDERVRAMYNKFLEGGGRFTATTRQNFYNGLRGILASQRGQVDQLAESTKRQATGYQLDPERTMERWKPGAVPEPVKDPQIFGNRRADGTLKTEAEEQAEANQPGATRKKPIVLQQDYENAATAVDAAEQALADAGVTGGYVTIRIKGQKPTTRWVGYRE
jgi:hypothetical protein